MMGTQEKFSTRTSSFVRYVNGLSMLALRRSAAVRRAR